MRTGAAILPAGRRCCNLRRGGGAAISGGGGGATGGDNDSAGEGKAGAAQIPSVRKGWGGGRCPFFFLCVKTPTDGQIVFHRTAADPGDRGFDPPGDAQRCP
jgi:hypothetical protein